MEIDKQLSKILNGYQSAIILMTANKLGIFDQLSNTPVSANKIAKDLDLSLNGTERLLNTLCSLKIIIKDNNLFHLPKAYQIYLSKTGQFSMQPWIQMSTNLLPAWQKLPEYIKSGKQVFNFMNTLANEPEETRSFIDAMHIKGIKASHQIANEIPVGEAKHMLDVGCGPGTFTLEWCKLHKHLKGTTFDIPSVIEITKEYIKQYNLEDRISTKRGDFINDDLGCGYDLILLANILHMYDSKSGEKLVNKAAKSLAPGGRIIIHGFCTDEDGTSPEEDTLFNLAIALTTEGGMAHPLHQIVQWLKTAGIKDIRQSRINAFPTGLLTGIKPK
jgi:SAM-dependent methyltransferase